MIAGLDSASEPSAAQAQAAKAAGIGLWSGYIATQSNVGLYHPWPRQAFENARLCGGTPIAYASGWDDPSTCKALAAAWNVRLCLDIESGIRGDGNWAQNWLDAAGAGVYGNAPVHRLRAAFHILAAYPGIDPKATWSSYLAHPSSPCGWQFQGTHSEFGIGVDRGWFDDWFGGLHGGGSDSLSTSTGGSVALAPHPTMAGRVDELFVGADKAIWHVWGDVSAMDPAAESWGGQGVSGTLSAAWTPDGNVLIASVVGTDSHLWRKALRVDGSVLYDWNAVQGPLAAIPGGSPGPKGDKGDPGKDGAPGKDGVSPTTATIAGPIKVTLG